MDREEAIRQCREAELRESAALVLRDRELQALLAAWPMADVSGGVAAFPVFSPRSRESWSALWEDVSVDEAGLAEACGMPIGRAKLALRRARELRLVYPDGSIHAMAKLILQKLIKDALQG